MHGNILEKGGMTVMENRIGVVGIVLEQPTQAAEQVNAVLSAFSRIIIGRMGVPRHETGAAVIALIVQGDTDTIGALTGKLGAIKNVSVKSALTNKKLAME